MKGFIAHLEKETETNTNYRRVLYTAKHSQLVLMNLARGEEIGEEIHSLDQFIRVESGNGKAVLNGEEYEISDGDAVLVPEGVRHNIINVGGGELKLYTLYSPPNHKDAIVQATKAEENEEHFDGITTEQ